MIDIQTNKTTVGTLWNDKLKKKKKKEKKKKEKKTTKEAGIGILPYAGRKFSVIFFLPNFYILTSQEDSQMVYIVHSGL